MPPKKGRQDPAYLREQGKRKAEQKKIRYVTFSLTRQIVGEGQTIKEWQEHGFLEQLFERMKFVGQYSAQQATQYQYIKQYTKVSFPPESGFKEPKHIQGVTWSVMHLTTHSKEVVAGYLEDDVFYIVFLDKDHIFWPSQKKNT